MQEECRKILISDILLAYPLISKIFGQVESGMDVVKKIEEVGTSAGATKKKVVIADCGEVKTKST